MSNKRRVTQFSLPLTVFKEGKYFIAHTPLLNLSVQGHTEEETRKRFVDAVVLFFEELEDMGTTNEVLFSPLFSSRQGNRPTYYQNKS